MKHVLLYLTFINLCVLGYSQEKFYYDSLWHKTDIEHARFFHERFSCNSSKDEKDKTRDLQSFVYNDKRIIKIDFTRYIIPDSIFIGKKIMINDTQSIYKTKSLSVFNDTHWPNSELKKTISSNYNRLQNIHCGDTGRIICVFKKIESIIRNEDKVYIVKIKKDYIVISGYGLTMPYVDEIEETKRLEEIKKQNKKNRGIVLTGGCQYQKKLFGEFNLLYGKWEGSMDFYAFWGPTLGVESNFNGIVAPKIGYDINTMFLCFRINSISFIEKRNIDYRIMPEIGINILYGSLTYGYVPHLFGTKNDNIGKHRISLRFYVFPKDFDKNK